MTTILGFNVPDTPRAQVRTGALVNLSGTGARRILIPSEFYGAYAVDVLIDNTDPVLALTYRINSDQTATKNIPVGGSQPLADTKVVFIEIVTGGTWEIQLNLVPMKDGAA